MLLSPRVSGQLTPPSTPSPHLLASHPCQGPLHLPEGALSTTAMARLERDAFPEFSAGLAVSFTQDTLSAEVSWRVPGLAGLRPQRHHLLVENTWENTC